MSVLKNYVQDKQNFLGIAWNMDVQDGSVILYFKHIFSRL